ncbi:MAG: hypothetical protein PWP23_1777 [Candidatus Sumerlaeota bacterium]|nr:hypothetical protein [Candidatus Sumerlaeota bacterium]
MEHLSTILFVSWLAGLAAFVAFALPTGGRALKSGYKGFAEGDSRGRPA